MKRKIGKLTIHDNANVWPHEEKTGRALTKVGHEIDFYPASNTRRSADAFVDGAQWEFKAPTGANLEVVERNLKKGKHQASLIVFDSRRMKKVPDNAIERELRSRLIKTKPLQAIKFVNRHGEVIDINK
jgi:hypothetical protein